MCGAVVARTVENSRFLIFCNVLCSQAKSKKIASAVFFGGPCGDRTHDLIHAMDARYQLRQRPMNIMVERIQDCEKIINLELLLDNRLRNLLTHLPGE